jgi:hypothetical protein
MRLHLRRGRQALMRVGRQVVQPQIVGGRTLPVVAIEWEPRKKSQMIIQTAW